MKFSLTYSRLKKWRRPNWMKCGVLSFRKKISDGYGWRWTIRRGESLPIHSDGVKTRFFALFTCCSNHFPSPCFTLMTGVVIKEISSHHSMSSARKTRRPLNGKISLCVPISKDYAENPFASLNRQPCTIL